MKKALGIASVLLAVCLMSSAAYSADAQPELKAGMTVAAKWTDGNYYLAVIKSVNGTAYAVDYADGTSGEVTEGEILQIPPTPSLKKGDSVLAVWSGACFYPGQVKEVTPSGALIAWDDGSAPSTVEYGKIIKK